MSRTILNFLLDVALLLIFLSLIWVSTVLRFVFPPPTGAAGWTLWGFGYDAWANLQFNIVCLIILAVLVHVMLHWSWVCGVIAARLLGRKGAAARGDDGTQTLYGVATLTGLLLLLGGLILAARVAVQAPLG